MRSSPPVALSIAGTDSGGGAGVTADLRAFTACGVHGSVAVAAVTVQNSVGVSGFHEVPRTVVADQIRAVAGDMGVDAAKTGMLASAEIIATVVASTRWRPRCTVTRCWPPTPSTPSAPS